MTTFNSWSRNLIKTYLSLARDRVINLPTENLARSFVRSETEEEGGGILLPVHFDNRAAKLYLVDSQLDTRLAIVHRKKEERPFFFFFFLPLFLRLKVAEDDK